MFKNLFKSYGKIISNFSYLSVLQLSNLLLPILIYPYLISVLGGEKYGKVIFAQVLMGYLAIIVNFGFNIIGTKEISENRNNPEKLNDITNSIYQIKFILFFITLVLTLILSLFFEIGGSDKFLYIFSIWACLNELVMPVWYFQGIEDMAKLTILNFLNKIMALGLIYFLINGVEDYYLVPLCYLLGVIFSSMGAMILLKKDGRTFQLANIRSLKYYLKKSYVVALSYGFNAFKTNFSIILCKVFFSYTAVAYYDLAMKIVNVLMTFLDLISQAIFPKMSLEKDVLFFRKMLRFSILGSVLFTFLLMFTAPIIINILGNNDMEESILLLRILAVVLPIYIIGALVGRNALIIHGFDKDVLVSMIVSAMVYISTILFAIYGLEIKNILIIAIAFVISFGFESTYRYYKARKYQII